MMKSDQRVESHSLPGPHNLVRTTLANGLTLLVRENQMAPVVVLEGYLPAGGIHDPADKVGLNALVAGMLTRGSAHFDFDTLNETVDAVGANLSVEGDDHVTGVSLKCLSDDFPHLLEILADLLLRPTFPAHQLERLRGQRLVAIQQRDQDTGRMAYLRCHELLYGDHPYGRSLSGYRHTVSAITLADVERFYQARYTPQGAILVISGAVQADAVLEQITRLLGDWEGPIPQQELPPLVCLTASRQDQVLLPGKFQSDIVLGCLALRRDDPDFYAVRVADTILGRFGMMGRLGAVVREEQGLAYYCYSMVQANKEAGPWLALAGVNPAHVAQAVESIQAELARLGDETVDEAELQDSLSFITGTMPMQLETNDGVASVLLDMEWYGLGLDYLLRYPTLIRAVTAADVQRVARRYLRQDRTALVVAGPAAYSP